MRFRFIILWFEQLSISLGEYMGEKISLNNILIDYWGMVSYHTSSPLFESICRYYTTTYRFYNCTRKEEKQKAKEKGKDIPI